MKLTDLAPKPLKIIIYGEVGSGKTALVETLGEHLLLADFDDGARTGLGIEDNFKPSRLKIDVKQYLEEDPSSRATAFAKFKQFAYGLSGDIKRGAFPYKALAIDSLTAFADAAVLNVLANSGNIKGPPQIQHWGSAFLEIKNVLAVLRSLPISIILIAHEQVKTVGKGEDREERLQIAVSGQKLPNEICRFFDEIWYLRAKSAGGNKRQYLVQTLGTDNVSARSRASLPNLTDTNVGMVELMKRCGYDITRKEDSQASKVS